MYYRTTHKHSDPARYLLSRRVRSSIGRPLSITLAYCIETAESSIKQSTLQCNEGVWNKDVLMRFISVKRSLLIRRPKASISRRIGSISRRQPVIFVTAPVFRQAVASRFLSGLNQLVILTQYELTEERPCMASVLYHLADGRINGGFRFRKKPFVDNSTCVVNCCMWYMVLAFHLYILSLCNCVWNVYCELARLYGIFGCSYWRVGASLA